MNTTAQVAKRKATPAAPAATRRASASPPATATPRYLRASLKVGGVNDPEEHEAEHAASVIAAGGTHQVRDPGGRDHLRAEATTKKMSGPAAGAECSIAAPVVDPGGAGRIKRAVAPPVVDPGGRESLRRAATTGTTPGANAAGLVEAARASPGQPLGPTVRGKLELGLGEQMDSVRIHKGPTAARAASAIGARAYTEGERITLGHGESEHDLRLLAHEATHVVQNRRGRGRRDHTAVDEGRMHTAANTAATTTSKAAPSTADPAGATATSTGPIRRSIISRALDWLADKANIIPGFRLFTIILGVNPINMSKVSRSGANILRGLVDLLPGVGDLIADALEKYGVLDRAGAWIDKQLNNLAITGAAIRDALMEFLDSLGWTDIFHPGEVWDRAKRIFTDPIDRIKAFFHEVLDGIMQFIRDAVLKPLSALASKLPFWDLLVGVLGNPITGEKVESGPEVMIGGFMKLIHQEEIWENLQKSHAVARAWAWFKGTLKGLLGFVSEIPTLFFKALKSFQITDLLDLPGAFGRAAGIFVGFVGDFINWAGEKIWNLLEIIFDVVSPTALQYIKRTGRALRGILKDPLPFVRNLVKAAKLGLQNFMDHIGEHLKEGLIDWLTGSLPGVYIPKAFEFAEIAKFAFSVLGLTWQNLRQKLVKAVGEPAVAAMEAGFDIVVTLVKEGPAAAWEKIKEHLTNLEDTVIDGIKDFVMTSVITKAVPKLIAMFIPGAGFISAIISIYDTIMVFVQKLAKIKQVVVSFVDSIVDIAAGVIGKAADRVESTLTGILALAINFLAGFAGLGKVADKIRNVLEKVRAPIDKALDKLVNVLVSGAKKFFSKGKAAAAALFSWAAVKTGFKDPEGKGHTIYVDDSSGEARLMIASDPLAAQQFLKIYIGGKKEKDPEFEKNNATKIADATRAIEIAAATVKEIAAAKQASKSDSELTGLQRKLLEQNIVVSGALSSLIGRDPLEIKELRDKYLLEGLTGTYESMPKPKSDQFTADHQPQAAVLEAVVKLDYFTPTGEMVERAEGRHVPKGIAINLHEIRHKAGATYASKGKTTKKEFLESVKTNVMGKPPKDQPGLVVKEIRKDLDRDVKKMKEVASPTSAYWTDIPGTEAQKKDLVNEVSTRIKAGEDQIQAQNIEALAN